MCGIAALWGLDDEAAVRDILKAMVHRGPDGQGLHDPEGEVSLLGHRRLAIIDPEGGEQPITCPESGATLIANGMIYNDRALRRELADKPFTTQSDSESILQGYRAWGSDVAARLDGMFAFVIQDGERLIAARDPLGIKPLYWARLPESEGGAIAFASEIGALARVAGDIEEFPNGHVFDSETGLRRYYDFPAAGMAPMAEEQACARIRETLERAVVKRLRSDVPLGCFLSGGLDSSIISALSAKHLPELHTFAIGLPDSSDLEAARAVAEHIGSIHHEEVIDPEEIAELLPQALARLEQYDRDLVRSALPTFLVARAARRHGMKVILTGEGADELFAGYTYYDDYEDPAALQTELRRSLMAMHDVNLHRVDRMTMAHNLEARVPFLDTEMIALGMEIPATLKQRRDLAKGQSEKYILRKAFEDLLPHDIVWRVKEQFDEGSGFGDHLQNAAAGYWQARGGQALPEDARDVEEAVYRALVADAHGPRAERVLPLSTVWADEDSRVAA